MSIQSLSTNGIQSFKSLQSPKQAQINNSETPERQEVSTEAIKSIYTTPGMSNIAFNGFLKDLFSGGNKSTLSPETKKDIRTVNNAYTTATESLDAANTALGSMVERCLTSETESLSMALDALEKSIPFQYRVVSSRIPPIISATLTKQSHSSEPVKPMTDKLVADLKDNQWQMIKEVAQKKLEQFYSPQDELLNALFASIKDQGESLTDYIQFETNPINGKTHEDVFKASLATMLGSDGKYSAVETFTEAFKRAELESHQIQTLLYEPLRANFTKLTEPNQKMLVEDLRSHGEETVLVDALAANAKEIMNKKEETAALILNTCLNKVASLGVDTSQNPDIKAFKEFCAKTQTAPIISPKAPSVNPEHTTIVAPVSTTELDSSLDRTAVDEALTKINDVLVNKQGTPETVAESLSLLVEEHFNESINIFQELAPLKESLGDGFDAVETLLAKQFVQKFEDTKEKHGKDLNAMLESINQLLAYSPYDNSSLYGKVLVTMAESAGK